MKLNSLTPNMMVKDVNSTIEWYEKHMGFTTKMTVPDSGKLNWAMMVKDGVTLMFQEEHNLKGEYNNLSNLAPGNNALTFYIYVQDIEQLHSSLKDNAAVNIVKKLDTTFYGQTEFAVEDPNRFTLTFSESK